MREFPTPRSANGRSGAIRAAEVTGRSWPEASIPTPRSKPTLDYSVSQPKTAIGHGPRTSYYPYRP